MKKWNGIIIIVIFLFFVDIVFFVSTLYYKNKVSSELNSTLTFSGQNSNPHYS